MEERNGEEEGEEKEEEVSDVRGWSEKETRGN